MTPAELWQRFEEAAEYHRALANADDLDWDTRLARHRQGDLPFTESLVLIHPNWYRHLEDEGSSTSVRGRRAFRLSSRRGECDSQRCWGYRCPHHHADIQVDHFFPYALGGPTEPENALWLCSTHNAGKGGDIHVVPLRAATERWFPTVLEKIEWLRVRSSPR